MDDEVDPSETLKALTASLDQVEKLLDPLLQKPWSETLEALDVLQRAKLQVLVSYAVNDLVWVYMQMKGLKSEEHGVQSELDRLKKYFAKIKFAENPETRRSTIDKAAAARFIAHGIPVSQRLAASSSAQAREAAIAAMDVDDDVSPDVGMATRFRHIEAIGSAEHDEEAEALLEGVLEASLAAGELSEAGTESMETIEPMEKKSGSGKKRSKKDKVAVKAARAAQTGKASR